LFNLDVVESRFQILDLCLELPGSVIHVLYASQSIPLVEIIHSSPNRRDGGFDRRHLGLKFVEGAGDVFELASALLQFPLKPVDSAHTTTPATASDRQEPKQSAFGKGKPFAISARRVS